MRFGLNLYGVSGELRKDPEEFFARLRRMGYREIEPCIWLGQTGAEKVCAACGEEREENSNAACGGEREENLSAAGGAGGNISSAFWSVAEAGMLLEKAAKAGLQASSAHIFVGELETALPAMKRLAEEFGIRQFVLPFPMLAEVETEREAGHGTERGAVCETEQEAAQIGACREEQETGSDVWREAALAYAAKLRHAAEVLVPCGARLLLHNGPEEIALRIDGKTEYEWLLDACGGSVGAQPDAGWLWCGGEDPEAFLWRNEECVWSLHCKDICAKVSPETEDADSALSSMVCKDVCVKGSLETDGLAVQKDIRARAAVSGGKLPDAVFGTGAVDLAACFQFARAHGILQIVDLDGSEGDIMEAAAAAIRYLSGLTQYRDDTASILCSLDADTGELVQMHRFDEIIEAPNWLKDGSLYYNSNGRIWRYIPETDRIEPVNTGSCVNCNNDHVPSPDNRLLAVSENGVKDWSSHIYVTDPRNGTARLATVHSPSYLHGWSPDGGELAYCAFRDHGGEEGMQVDIYTIAVDPSTGTPAGEEVRRTFGGFNDGPEYSPDGQHIWFNSTRTGLMQVWRMNRDGSAPQQMTFEPSNNWFGHVSPDGARVVYLSYQKGELDPDEHLPNMRVALKMMNYDGSGSRTLLEFFGGQGSINVNSWSPDSRKIAVVLYELNHR